MPPKRYFDDERSVKPGIISDELRSALNLHNDKLPAWIYKMRILGYPPGWLQQADISNSSLQLFDDSPQVDQSTSSQVHEQAFNPECFVEFPGFNAPVPEGVKDHCEILGMPTMQVWQQLQYVKKTILPPKPVPYKRLRLSSKNDKKNGSLSIEDEDDDEIQIIEPSKPENTEKKMTSLIREKEEGEATDSDDDIIAISSSIEEPTPKVQLNSSVLNISTTIIEEIPRSPDSIIAVSPCKSNSIDHPSTSPPQSPNQSNQDQSDFNIQSVIQLEDKKSTVDSQQSTSENQSENKKSTEDSSKSTLESPSTHTSSTIELPFTSPSIKLIAMGCPLPADIDQKKPPLEKFAVGMGELIYFENLPTSTGVFDKMRHVIHKVRKKLSE